MAGKWVENLQDLWDRITAARAGYLDELAPANMPTDITAILAAVGGLTGNGAIACAGTVSGIAGAPNFQCSNLIGFGNDYFEDWWAYVVWDAAGAGGAPQGECLECTGYTSATGDFTVAAFGAAIAVGDKVLIIHKSLALMLGLTAARAGYLDELAAANIPADVDGLKASRDRQLFSMTFWSLPQEEVAIPAVAADQALPDVIITDLPAGASIERATCIFVYSNKENSNAAVNKLNGAQEIQVRTDAPSAWANCIIFLDNLFTLAASTREGGGVIFGTMDVLATITGNDTYNFQWNEALADQDSIKFNDVQMGIQIWYSV